MSATRKLAAILAADVAGYSRLMGVDEEGTLERLKAHRREVFDPKIKEHHGRIVKTTGDGMLVTFASPVEAVRCAVEVQQEMVQRNASLPENSRIEFRVGINLGDVIIDGKDIYGDGVNVASRLEGVAEPGAVVISSGVYEHVRDKVPYHFADLGDHRLKNISRPVHLFRADASAAMTPRQPLPLPAKPSIAVLPFSNMSADPEQEYFADGITEEIITALAKVHWFFVIARNSSFTYKGRAIDVKQVARELGVQYVLEGSVRKAGNRIRITGQLNDALTASLIWADRFDGDLADIFEVQDRVTASVVGAIEPSLRAAEIERAKRKRPDSLAAYDYLLRALSAFHAVTRDSNEEALRLLDAALRVEPSYGAAYGFAAWLHVWQVMQGWHTSFEEEAEAGVQMARRALEFDKDNPEALFMAAHAIAYLGRDPQTGLAVVERSLTLNPNSAQGWLVCGWICLYAGMTERALTCFGNSVRLNPLDPLSFLAQAGCAVAHLNSGRYGDALDWARRSLRENERFITSHRVVAIACARLGLDAEAAATARHLLALEPTVTIERLRRRLPYRVPEHLELWLDGLRKAGLPE